MKKATTLKQRLVAAVLTFVMLVSSLVGTTFAWFTDEVESAGNTITSGNLKVDLSHKVGDSWVSLKQNSDHKVFNYDKWEPGYTRVESLKVENLGSLALQYRLSLEVPHGTAKLGENGENLADVIEVWVTDGESSETGYEAIKSAWEYKGTLAEVLKKPAQFLGGELLPTGKVLDANAAESTEVGSKTVSIALHMQKSAENEYQNLSVGDIYVNLTATQWSYENDAFGSDYDKDAVFPELNIGGITVDISTDGNVVNKEASVSGTGVSAIIPEGVLVEDGANKLGLSVTEKTESDANLTLNDGEALRALDVHMAGVSKNNTVPMLITVEKAMKPGLNFGNYKLYHVENGVANEMKVEDSADKLDSHNEIYYDPTTGDVTLAMATFSEVAVVAEPSKWEGNFDYKWYDASKTELTIANADQLAAFGAIVGGMDDQTQDSFAGKTVKLVADINLGDKESENNPNLIFYPIGYYNSEGTYERTNTAITSGLRIFEGTFDGNGHTVSNFYHNTWEMKGDHDWYSPEEQYYRDGMGLFGRVYKGTVKNLTVKNFSSDGEIATTGVIAAYADGATFENIAIFDCNPRVYNIGNGGIVGCVGWYAKEAELTTTFKNITVDNSNKISALWGSYDVACGGIVGQYYPTSGQSSANYPVNAGMHFENCHVSAVMDVYNDVCANYQYYAYRYTGMLIGSVRENETIDGHSYPKMDGITASGCTVHFGTWNDYYYCEIVANSLASYTHDHQFSRLTQVASVDVENETVTTLKGETVKIPASGWAHYVVVNGEHASENATCYHFNNGNVHKHEDSGKETVNGVEVLKEDNQHIYLEFNNLVTGYGWGVTSRGFDNLDGVTNLDIAQGDHEASVDKFESIGNITTYRPGQSIRVGDLFEAKQGTSISENSVYVSVSAVVDGEIVSAIFTLDAENWKNSTITFSADSVANAKVTITDYIFCNPTEIVLSKENEAPKFTANSVGDKNAYDTITLGALFNAIEGANIGDIIATVTSPDGTTTINATNSDWSSKVINLNKSGSWTISIKDNDDYCTETAVTINVKDINKFSNKNVGNQNAYTQITIGDLFNANADSSKIEDVKITVIDPNNQVTTISASRTDWATKTIALVKDGAWIVTITDNASCIESRVDFTVDKVDKFTKKFDKNFLYRVGNENTVGIGYIFGENATAVMLSSVNVDIKKVAGNVSGIFTANTSDWTKGTIQFTGTGVVNVTISADGANSVSINLEVVDAVNAIGATDAKSNNVVLLNDISASNLTVSNGWAFYGNGFTITFNGDGSYSSAALSYGFVTLNSGATLDNARIVCKVFPQSYMFTSEMKAGSDGRYPYGYSAIIMSDNSTVSNCYVYGARNNILVSTGDALITNTVTECGSLSNIQVLSPSSSTVTLDNVTTIQYQTTSPFDASVKVLGFGVVVGLPDSSSNATIKLTGDFNQYNWVTSDDTTVSNTYTQTAINGALKVSKYQHTNAAGDTTVNTGIAYMNSLPRTIIDERTNTGVKYEGNSVSISGYNGYVYSIVNKTGSPDAEINRGQFVNGAIVPSVTYNSKGDSDKLTTAFDTNTNRWVNTLTLDLDVLGSYTFNFSDLIASKYGISLDYEVKDANGNTVNKVTAITLNQLHNAEYTLIVTDNQIYNNKGELTNSTVKSEVVFAIHATKTSIEPPKFTGIGGGSALKTHEKSGLIQQEDNWRPAYRALENVSVTYWSESQGKSVTVDLSTLNNSGSISGNVWTYSCDDYTLTITGGAVHSDGSKISPKVVSGTLFFWSADKAFGTGTTSRDIILTYVFTDKNASTTVEYKGSVNFNDLEYYKKSDFANGKLTKGTEGGCFAEGTMITLADGTQKPIEQITYEDKLLAWDFHTGSYIATTASLIEFSQAGEYRVINLNFADGTVVRIIDDHGFFDVEANKFVFIDETNIDAYIGHQFVKVGENGTYENVELVGYEVTVENVRYYTIQTVIYNNCIAEGMFTLTPPPEMLENDDWFNYFEIGDGMKYDEEKKQADIEKYGLYTYEEFAEYATYEQFVAFNGAYLKVLVGKGVITEEQILELLELYRQWMPNA